MSQLENLLQQCIAKVLIPSRGAWGTGFFVASDRLLTCAHVVAGNEQTILIQWQNIDLQAVIEKSFSAPYDLALLRVISPNNAQPTCAYLDTAIQSRDPLYLFGYPDQDFPDGCPVTPSCEGLTGDEPPLIKFSLGQIRPGMSGAPLLNQRTGKVCGIIKFTRDRTSDLGGGAISTKTIFSRFPELSQLNQAYHNKNHIWKRWLPIALHLDRQEYQNRQYILSEVKKTWVKGVLNHSLHNQLSISQSFKQNSSSLSSTWGFVVETDDSSKNHYPAGTSIASFFDQLDIGRTLLILGEPGSGKTVNLLQLTEHLIAQAEQNSNFLIPVVLNLSSWKNIDKKGLPLPRKEISIKNWVIHEINAKYKVPRGLAQSWINSQRILLLLDGLDEVDPIYRNDCVSAINNFQKDQFTEMVVCSRSHDYELLKEKLNFQYAINLQYLSEGEINKYLENFDNKSLLGLKTLLKQDSALKTLAKVPLMLNVMIFAYKDIPAENLLKISVLKDRKSQLFNDYIDRVLEHSRVTAYATVIPASFLRERRYPYQLTVNRLVWLATKMSESSQTIYQPSTMTQNWLSKPIDHHIHTTLSYSSIYISSFLLIVFFVAFKNQIEPSVIWIIITIFLFTYLAFTYAYTYTQECISSYIHKRSNGLTNILSFVFIILFTLLAAGEFFSLEMVIDKLSEIMFLPRETTEEISKFANEIIQDNDNKMQLYIWSIIFIFSWLGSVVSILLRLNLQDQDGLRDRQKDYNILLKSSFPFIYLEETGKSALLPAKQEIKIKRNLIKFVNESFENSLLNFVFIPLNAVAGFTLCYLIFYDTSDLIVLSQVILLALVTGLLLALMGGANAWLSYIVLRLILFCRGYLPLRPEMFFDFAAERILLQKAGRGYRFMHRLLQEHFSAMPLD